MARAAVETVAENTSDGVVAPLVFLAIGGAPLGFLYKAVNTMDSMLGYTDPPYRNIGFFPGEAGRRVQFPARPALGPADAGGGSPAGDGREKRLADLSPGPVLSRQPQLRPDGVRLRRAPGAPPGGDAWYHGVLHKKPHIGDPVREIEHGDIPRACRLLYATAALALVLCAGCRALAILLL